MRWYVSAAALVLTITALAMTISMVIKERNSNLSCFVEFIKFIQLEKLQKQDRDSLIV